MTDRLVLVAVLTLMVLGVSCWYRRFRSGGAADGRDLPRLGSDITGGAARTWVVFSTPFCAACRPLIARLRSLDPAARVVEVPVADRPDLARVYSVRAAPTVLLAGVDGEIRHRLVGTGMEEALAAICEGAAS